MFVQFTYKYFGICSDLKYHYWPQRTAALLEISAFTLLTSATTSVEDLLKNMDNFSIAETFSSSFYLLIAKSNLL
ncbi:hypothetical protein T05_13566 [Trichinella murrelli]|uniref:Uncharacterized protein n=1 Tax=Trichinella murrelli TaxID=144512 RepID=A0A0V0UHE0_9BILA|nr:hypothetical protein T05_13566 [Trichinella murrelli]